MLSTNTYLHFAGNAEKAMNFYKKIFNGTFRIFQRYKEIPGGEKLSAEEQDKLIHVTLDIGNGIIIMATDALQSMGRTVTQGNNVYTCLHTDTEAETEKIFGLLSEEGDIEMPLNKTFWGAYFGMCRDKYGVHWMINYTYPQSNK